MFQVSVSPLGNLEFESESKSQMRPRDLPCRNGAVKASTLREAC